MRRMFLFLYQAVICTADLLLNPLIDHFQLLTWLLVDMTCLSPVTLATKECCDSLGLRDITAIVTL